MIFHELDTLQLTQEKVKAQKISVLLGSQKNHTCGMQT